MNFLLGIILWLGVNISSTQYLIDSTSLLTLCRLLTCPILAYLSRFIPSSKSFHSGMHGSSLTQTISPITILSWFHFFSTCLDIAPILLNLELSSTHYWEFGLTPLKDSIIVRYSESDLSLFNYLSPINICLSL